MPLYLALYVFAIAANTQAAVITHRGEKLTIRAALKMRATALLDLFVVPDRAVGHGSILPMIAAGVLIGPLVYLIGRPSGSIVTIVVLDLLCSPSAPRLLSSWSGSC